MDNEGSQNHDISIKKVVSTIFNQVWLPFSLLRVFLIYSNRVAPSSVPLVIIDFLLLEMPPFLYQLEYDFSGISSN